MQLSLVDIKWAATNPFKHRNALWSWKGTPVSIIDAFLKHKHKLQFYQNC